MPLPPIKIADKVQKAAYDDLARGSMRKFGDALAIIADRIVNPHFKSPEERALDWQSGSEESECRRRLAAEALERVPPERRIFPAPQIMGPIFRGSEFELPETAIWKMWSELLSRACDRDHVDDAHPAFPGIISQLSTKEAELMSLIWEGGVADALKYEIHKWAEADVLITEHVITPTWKRRLEFFPDYHVGIERLSQLKLIDVDGDGGVLSTTPDDEELVVVTYTCEISYWGGSFMRAVRQPTTRVEFE